jgi:O-antigen/teichoic acid export membrane protein
VAVNYLGVGVLAGTGFFLTPFMLHMLGRGQFGLLMLATAIFAYGSLLDFGLGISVMKMVADHAHDADRDHVRRLLSTVLLLYVGIGMAIIAVGLLIAPVLRGAFHLASADQHAFHWCYLLAMVAVGVTFPMSAFTAVITGHRDFVLQNRFVIGQALVSAAATVVVLELGYGVIAVAAIGLCTAIGVFAIKVLVVRKKYDVSFSPRYADRALLRSILAFASWVFVINVAASLIFETDIVVVGALLGPVAVAAYQVALSPNTVLQQFGEQFNVVALTATSSFQARGERERVRRLFLESTRAATVVMLPFAIVVAAWGGDFIRLWVGSSFRGSDHAFLILTIAMVEFAVQGTAAQVIIAHSKHKVIAIATACEAAANLLLSVLLGSRFGITGVAAGTLIPTTFTACCVALPYASRIAGTSARDLAVRVGFPVLQAVGIVLVLRALGTASAFHSMATLIGAGAVLAGLFIAVNLFGFSSERATYYDMVRRRVGPGRRQRDADPDPPPS